MENVSLLTPKKEQGASLQRQQTGRGLRRCGLRSARCEPHTDTHRVKSNQASAPESAEQGGNERPTLIPLWAEGSYGLGGQGDLLRSSACSNWPLWCRWTRKM